LLLRFWAILAGLLVVFAIDLEHYLILDNVILIFSSLLIAINLASSLLAHQALWSPGSYFISGFLGAIIAALPFFLIWYFSKGQWMGFGDVKLALLLGIALGLPNVFIGIFIGILLGGVFSAFLLIFTKSTLKTRVPFGTFLAIGAGLALFFGQFLLHWYLALLGF
jgi:leader peptidase (prepilin peptidase)/N-methyltransferase